MKTIRLTVAQAVIKFLNQQYIEFDGKKDKFVRGIFTIFGHGNVVGLGQALEEMNDGLEVYQGRNEQGMAHIAAAYAKQKNRKQIFACTSSVGPGAANMITAAATATANNIPLLLLPGDVFASRQPDPVLQQIEQPHNLSISTNDAFKPVSKYWDRVNRPEQLMTAMINAMRVLTDQAETGAVTICLPQDVQGEAYDFPTYFFKERIHRIDRRCPSEAALQDALAMITRKKKPIIVCGGGVRYSEAGEALKAFAEAFNIPFAETQAGKSAVVYSHALNLGGIGVTGDSAANEIARGADLVIGIGTRFTDFTTGSKSVFANDEVDFLTINVSEFHAGKLDATKVVGDAKVALECISNKLKEVGYKTAYTHEIQQAQATWKSELERLYKTDYQQPEFVPEADNCFGPEKIAEYSKVQNSALTQTGVLGELDHLFDDSAIVVGASGSLPGDLQRVWRAKEVGTYHMEYGYSCMGYEVAAAVGVKLAEPNREVYAMVGDGSYLMLHSELVTSIQEDIKINIMLFDNIGFGCINNLQMGNGMGSFCTEFRKRNGKSGKLDGDLMKIDFAKQAEAYGAKTYSVTTLSELRFAVEDAKKQQVSTLIDIKILPKTMTHGYGAGWHVGIAEISSNPKINEAFAQKEQFLAGARKY